MASLLLLVVFPLLLVGRSEADANFGLKYKRSAITCPKFAVTNPSTNPVKAYSGPYDCFNRELRVYSLCQFHCPPGYNFRGPSTIACQQGNPNSPKGTWNTGGMGEPVCTDAYPPEFADSRCQNAIEIRKNTLPGKAYAEVTLPKIAVADNSGETPTITAYPKQYQMEKTYPFNWTSVQGTTIMFTATDKAGLSSKCRIIIIVRDTEKPKVKFCPSNIVLNTNQPSVIVNWKQPIFEDNCGHYPSCVLQAESTIRSGSRFTNGPPVSVEYTVIDPSHNKEYCSFTVTVQTPTCPPMKAPLNGAIVMSNHLALTFCEDRKSQPMLFGLMPIRTCRDGKWKDLMGREVKALGSCRDDGTLDPLQQMLQYKGKCGGTATNTMMKARFQQFLGCSTEWCSIDKLKVICG